MFVKHTSGFEGGLVCLVDSKKSVILHLFYILPVIILWGESQQVLWVVQSPMPFLCLLPFDRRSFYPTVWFIIFMLLLFSGGFDRFLSASNRLQFCVVCKDVSTLFSPSIFGFP